jgi:hypothetical protein
MEYPTPIQFTIVRSPASSDSYFKEKHFQCRLWAGPADGYLRLFFDTGNGSEFRGGISPSQFADLARAMVATDLEAAIKAFGAALQQVEMPKPPKKPFPFGSGVRSVTA